MTRSAISFLWLAAWLSIPICGSASVKITRFDAAGALAWTNSFCTSNPVYEIVRAPAITGSWQHVAYVTNQHSFSLPDPIPSGASMAFYRVAWIENDPIILDYAYDEHGIGEPSVIGTLTLHLPTMSATWFFEETDFNTSPHPLGAGFGGIGQRQNDETLIIRLRMNPDDGVYLEGQLRSSPTASNCGYAFSGMVYWINFTGTFPIGPFIARQEP
ncbi:MAG: hypothetical protein L0Y58_05320 [Verrucomicrobia subdivision 3 bacterium]|nr:hypothetical protein [Limisphaerales bacterium]